MRSWSFARSQRNRSNLSRALPVVAPWNSVNERSSNPAVRRRCESSAHLPFACIVEKSEIPFPVSLDIRCTVNGELRQSSNTGRMIFDLPAILSDLSKGLTLYPGDIISTGTPGGVGAGFTPPRFLSDGDLVECSVEKIGTLSNPVKATD